MIMSFILVPFHSCRGDEASDGSNNGTESTQVVEEEEETDIILNEGQTIVYTVVGYDFGGMDMNDFLGEIIDFSPLKLGEIFIHDKDGDLDDWLTLDLTVTIIQVIMDYLIYDVAENVYNLLMDEGKYDQFRFTADEMTLYGFCEECKLASKNSSYTMTETSKKITVVENFNGSTRTFTIEKLSDITYAINLGDVFCAYIDNFAITGSLNEILATGEDSVVAFIKEHIKTLMKDLNAKLILSTALEQN